MKLQGLRCKKPRLKAVGTRCNNNATSLYQQKLAVSFLTIGGSSVVGINATEIVVCFANTTMGYFAVRATHLTRTQEEMGCNPGRDSGFSYLASHGLAHSLQANPWEHI